MVGMVCYVYPNSNLSLSLRQNPKYKTKNKRLQRSDIAQTYIGSVLNNTEVDSGITGVLEW